jgi:hypothetical protein
MFLFTAFVFAENNDSVNNSVNNSETDTVLSDTSEEEVSNADKAFECLVSKLGQDCSGAETIQELSFSILASVNVSEACVDKMLEKEKDGVCFGESGCSIKETAWAILALNHVRRDTGAYVDWLLNQSKTSTNVEWFLQEDSEGETECKLTYDNSDYTFIAAENKKLSGNFGPCFSLAQSNYWLKLNGNCLDKEFILRCNKNFFTGWHYKSVGSQVLNVLSETASKVANDPVTLSVKSKCFGTGIDCNFEDTAWAAIALKNNQKEVSDYVSYLISSEDSSYMYFPAALNYLVLDFSVLYGNKIIKRTNGDYWESDNSIYGKYYDTALALLALGNQDQEQITNARKWIWDFAQDNNGCWNSNNIRDTAFLLWALEGRDPVLNQDIPTPTVIYCESSGGFCTSEFDCLGAEGEILTNYFCSGVSRNACCSVNPLKSCFDLLGEVCEQGLECSGIEKDSLDGACCMEECVEPSIDTDNCQDVGGFCRSSCRSDEEEVTEFCEGSKICCVSNDSGDEDEEEGIPLWVWLLIGILLILIVLVIVFRDRIKVWYHKRKKGNNSSSATSAGGSSGPPRPGFPPLVRPSSRPMVPPNRTFSPRALPPRQNQSSNDTFAKLKEMTK